MSTSKEHPAVDVGKGSGISADVADAARGKILAAAIEPVEGKPVTFVSHQAETRVASNRFLQVSIVI